VRAPKTPTQAKPKRAWRRAKNIEGARVQVPVYRQQRPEDSKIGTQSATGRQQSSRVLFRAVAALAYDSDMSSESDDELPSPIHEAARNADVETLRRLLKEGESPDKRNNSWTPLHALCAVLSQEDRFHDDDTEDRVACLRLLVDAGANPDAACRLGYTALHRAAQARDTAIVSLLLEAGANVNAAANLGGTALHYAAHRGSTDCVEVLLAAGASVNARDNNGNNPLDHAIIQDHRRAWPLFLRAGAEFLKYDTDPYLVRIRNAGGFKKYEQAHITRITAILAQTPRLPPEMARKIVEFWLHAGYY
jgi:hypothetical protein